MLLIIQILFLGNVTLGTYEGDKHIYFYEGGSTIGESLYWDDSLNYFRFTDDLMVVSLSASSNIFTQGSGDDLWLGDNTQGDANFQAYADGSLIIADKKYNVSTTGNLTAKTDVCILGGNCLASFVGGTDSFSANYSTFLTHATTTYVGTQNTSMKNYVDGTFLTSYMNLTEDNVEAYIFDNDNTANLNMSYYNITGVDCITFESGGQICSD